MGICATCVYQDECNIWKKYAEEGKEVTRCESYKSFAQEQKERAEIYNEKYN
jgi:hypothetical protein